MSWGFDMLFFISLKRKSTRSMLSTFPFDRWGDWGTEASMKFLVSERDPVVLRAYWSTLGTLCGKYTVCLECCGGKSISVISIKKKTQNEVCYWDY